MFEDYLEDAAYFAAKVKNSTDPQQTSRYSRASIFHTMGAIEAFINYIGDTFAQSNVYEAYEIAFLTDYRFGFNNTSFDIITQVEYHRIEDKIRFLITKFIPGFDFEHNKDWCQLLQFKKFRDLITHPRQNALDISPNDYIKNAKLGLNSVIGIIDSLCRGIFDRPLRKRLTDLLS